MSLTCPINCNVISVKNTGTTEDNLIFVDCSGQTISVAIQSGDTTLLTYCSTNSISGNTSGNLSFGKPRKVTYAYYFSSCCETNDVFTFYSTEFELSLDDAIYAKQFINSSTGQPVNLQCCYLYDKIPVKALPPINGYLISVLNGVEIQKEFACEQCTQQYPCLKQCYGLYSCDGGYPIITATNPNLSGYVDSFIYIDIGLPSPDTPTTAFLVKDLGIIDCSTEYEITIVSSADTCDCSCYSFRLSTDPIQTVFVDCDYNLLEVYFPTGQTINICSLVRPIFLTRRPIGVKLGGKCVNGKCPPPPPISIKPRNECDVLTIFPMDVECFVTHPSSPYSYDGEAAIGVTGGTPPYIITWEIGSVSSVITNLNVGEYSATVTDYYGDFTINTTCVLTGETTTTTSTTTIKPLPIYDNLCLIFIKRSASKVNPFETLQVQLEFNGYKNEKPEWLSIDEQYNLYWTTGNTNYWTISGYTSQYASIVNNTTSIPPLNGWQVLGAPEIYSVSVLSGNCTSENLVGFTVSLNSAKCENDGSMIIQAYGGSGIYQYSIDNGLTYSSNPIFQGLNPGTYVIFVKDSNNVTSIQSIVLPSTQLTTTVIQLSANTTNNTFIIGSNVPPGSQVTFDLNFVSTFNYYPNTLSPQPQFDNVPNVIGFGNLTETLNNLATTPLSLPCSQIPLIQNNQYKEYKNSFTLTNNQFISGSFTNNVINQPIGPCTNSNKSYQIFISNAKIDNCKCCEIKIINPPTKLDIQKN
jgi:hypothetical protein